MSKLSAFLHPVEAPVEEKEIVISTRFQDEHGKPVPFKIRSLTQEENDALIEKATRREKVKGGTQERFVSKIYRRALVVAGTVEPDFTSEELCKGYGVLDPDLVPGKMLKAGEFSTLVQAISDLSGFEDDTVEEEAKN